MEKRIDEWSLPLTVSQLFHVKQEERQMFVYSYIWRYAFVVGMEACFT